MIESISRAVLLVAFMVAMAFICYFDCDSRARVKEADVKLEALRLEFEKLKH